MFRPLGFWVWGVWGFCCFVIFFWFLEVFGLLSMSWGKRNGEPPGLLKKKTFLKKRKNIFFRAATFFTPPGFLFFGVFGFWFLAFPAGFWRFPVSSPCPEATEMEICRFLSLRTWLGLVVDPLFLGVFVFWIWACPPSFQKLESWNLNSKPWNSKP